MYFDSMRGEGRRVVDGVGCVDGMGLIWMAVDRQELTAVLRASACAPCMMVSCAAALPPAACCCCCCCGLLGDRRVYLSSSSPKDNISMLAFFYVQYGSNFTERMHGFIFRPHHLKED